MSGTGTHAPVVPQPNGRGTLTTATGDQLPVQTYDQAGQEVVLIVLTQLTDVERARGGQDGAPHAGPAADPATLEYVSQRGIIRLHGEAVFEDRSVVRFRPEDEPEIIQRRAFVRVHTPQPVALEPELGHDVPNAYTIDLSGGGMLLSGAPMLQLNDTVGFEVSVGEGLSPICGVARVVRIDADGRRGLAFDQIDEAERQRLIRFVFACMRESRAKTRGDHF